MIVHRYFSLVFLTLYIVSLGLCGEGFCKAGVDRHPCSTEGAPCAALTIGLAGDHADEDMCACACHLSSLPVRLLHADNALPDAPNPSPAFSAAFDAPPKSIDHPPLA